MVEWSRVYAAGDLTILREVTQTADGGFVAAGYASGSTSTDAIVLKIAESGLVEWGALFGSAMGDAADSVQQTADAGYIVAGVTNAYYDASSTDYSISKFTAAGDVEWSYILGGLETEGDFATDLTNATIRQSGDGGYYFGRELRFIWRRQRRHLDRQTRFLRGYPVAEGLRGPIS